MQMEGGRDEVERETTSGTRGSATCRRAGSSWNRPTSAWNAAGAKDLQRQRRKVSPTDFAGEAFEGASRTRGLECDIDSSKPDDPRVQLNVQKEDGLFKVKGSVETVVDPDTLYGIITNYNGISRVFRDVDRVEVEQKGDDKVVTQFLHWNFLMWSGNYSIKMRMRDDPQNRSIFYDLEQPGFLKVFNGSWTVQPLSIDGTSGASKLVLDQKVKPAFLPPGPLALGAGSYAQKIMSNQVQNLLSDVATEATSVKKRNSSASSS